METDRAMGADLNHITPSVIEFYRGKDIFLTGATGFVGKVVLEKILRSLPECGRVFVLVRPKKGLSVEQRLQEEIFLSPIFDRLKAKIDNHAVYGVWPKAPSTFYAQHQPPSSSTATSSSSTSSSSSQNSIQPNNTAAEESSSGKDEKKKRNKNENSLGPRPPTPKFDEYVRQKVKAVGGDVSHEHIGLSKADRSALMHGLPNSFSSGLVVIHCAATVDFAEPLQDAVAMNIMGALRMLELAKSCGPRLSAHVHVSTAYVNSPRRGQRIEEKIYPMPYEIAKSSETVKIFANPELGLQRLLSMSRKDLDKLTPKIIGAFSKHLHVYQVSRRTFDSNSTWQDASVDLQTYSYRQFLERALPWMG
eukprot:TRINITY_DN3441_c0_g2_i1.p1 TRINITY_DN3441_c0_g2~~TRINITY_DN3441_c0_g2_i1.p1  ORF type:complete len:374 (+),score=76.33 TRINITY_DN3441_c0_g2_i1:34-1122(+)